MILRKQYYTFNPDFDTITFNLPDFSPEKIESIYNLTQKVMLFDPKTGWSNAGGAFSGNVLTLDRECTGMSANDVIYIDYDTDIFLNKIIKYSFHKTIASGLDTGNFALLTTGAGQTVSQGSGNLILASGTTANSETIMRSLLPFGGNLILKHQIVLSQRIANNNFSVELVDIIGDALAFTVSSATAVVVTIPNNPFTSANVGQSMNICKLSGVAGAIPMVAVIASVSGNNVTLTVTGYPASGSGTCSLTGWNEYSITYSGTTATNAVVLNRKNGWALAGTTATINTTASPGHMSALAIHNDHLAYLDQLIATGTVAQQTLRSSAVVNLIDTNVQLYLQIRLRNGTTNPATTTTATIGMVSVEQHDAMPTTTMQSRHAGGNGAQQVVVQNAALAVNATETALVAPTSHTLAHAATTNATSVKNSAGTVYSINVSNTHSAIQYLKLYNKASAPTMGTDVPVLVIPVPAGGVQTIYLGRVGARFATGIALASTLSPADSATDSVVVSTLKSIVTYI
jgi:hypothetical protein